jgi:hypothetical protein
MASTARADSMDSIAALDSFDEASLRAADYGMELWTSVSRRLLLI